MMLQRRLPRAPVERARALLVVETMRWEREIAVLVGMLIGLAYVLVLLKVLGLL